MRDQAEARESSKPGTTPRCRIGNLNVPYKRQVFDDEGQLAWVACRVAIPSAGRCFMRTTNYRKLYLLAQREAYKFEIARFQA
jgi:hypothetical protein